MSPETPILYGFCFPHHGKYSSYARLLDYMPECRVVRVEEALPATAFRAGFKKVRSFFWLQEWRIRRVANRYPQAVLHHIYSEATVQQGWLPQRGRYVLTAHQPPEGLEATREQRAPFFRAAQRADAIIILDASQAEDYARVFGHDRLVAIPHGIDTDRFAPAATPCQRGSDAPLEVLTVGAWLRDWDQWHAVFRETVARLPNVRFTVLSRPEIVAELKERVGNDPRFNGLSGLSDDELLDLYRASDVLFLPLSGATANNALLEAASCGLAVVCTDLSALRGYLFGTTGNCWYPAKEPATAASYLQQLANSPAQCSFAGQQNRQRMLDVFGWPVIAHRHLEVYRQVAEGTPFGSA
ncbi:MAG: glycosyltransferase family 4 protein [Verrucomicrobiota bacterium JB022]|nr:glycosyltransferase family 4 protein [Verrucomicrobiota bacterium JB022]